MFKLKQFNILLFLITFSINSSILYTLEESEIRWPILIIINETARSNNIELKLISLEYINEALSLRYGNVDISVLYDILRYLVFEGVKIITPSNDVSNNYPIVRIEAIKLLGQLNIIEARMTLFEVLEFEYNPTVLQEAIKQIFINWSDFYSNDKEVEIIFNTIKKIQDLSKIEI